MSADSRIRLVIFDCDGTLVDSQGAIIAALRAAFSEHGLGPPDARAVRQVVGLDLEEAIGLLLPRDARAKTGDLAESYRKYAYARRESGEHKEPLFGGARQAIEALSQSGWLLGIATMKSHRGLTELLAEHEISEHFVTLQTTDNSPGKPDPGMILRAMTEAGAAAADTVMVGDTTFDMEMAVNAAIHPVGVAWGYHDVERLRAAGAETIVDEFSGLPAVLESMIGSSS